HLMMMLPILLRLFIFYKPPQKKETYFYGFALLCGFLALYATYARGPWISFATVVVLMLLFTFFKSKLRPKIKWPIAAGIILGLAFSLKYTDKVIEQFGEQRKTSAMSRIYLGEVAWRLIQDNLAFGVGPGNYEINSPRYVVPIKEYPTEHLSEIVHNTYLLIFSESGVLGIAAFALILIQMCVICFLMFRSNHGIGLNLAIGGAMAILALAISFIASPDIHNEQTLNQMFLTVGMVFACELMERRHAAVQRQLQVQQRRENMQAKQERLAAAEVHTIKNGQTVSNGATPPRPIIGAADTMRDLWPPGRRT
ncbi:MAG: O-antigen ligase family protein, partial [bacterium]